MKKSANIAIGILFCLLAAHCSSAAAADPQSVSGAIEKGYRILPVERTSGEVRFTVYRGDYIKFEFPAAMSDPVLKIPALKVDQRLPADLEQAPYFKMKEPGTVAFTLGAISGDITVIDYRQPNYREIDAETAAELIANIQPIVLDVRTPAEYQEGHLENAVLIPVQELQSRWRELEGAVNQDILIYCASGNRSTVAAKILIDAGFKRIYNLRHGIAEWRAKNLPLVR